MSARADLWAAALRDAGVRPGDQVVVFRDRGSETVAAIHGALRAGACYVPIDAQTPALRARKMIDDCRPKALIGDDLRLKHQALSGVDAAILTTAGPRPSRPAAAPPRLSPRSPAYVLYTSGSTGVPKGALIDHAAAMSFVSWAQSAFRLRPEDTIASLASFQFDLSVFDLFDGCLAGACVALMPHPEILFAAQLARWLLDQRPTVLYTVPSVLAGVRNTGLLEPGSLAAMRLALFAGEVMPRDVLSDWMRFAPAASFFNLYGPTETNVCLSYAVPRPLPEALGSLPIGLPLPDVRVVIAREDGKACRDGEAGELWVRARTAMRGYLGGPSTTNGTWARPWRGAGLFYRTGDLVSKGADGLYRFHGRRDDQVKLRGYRVELGDVESALASHPLVGQAVVVVDSQPGGETSLKAFARPRDGCSLASDELVRFASERLPSYMRPSLITVVDDLPRLATGKIDRAALKAGLEAHGR